MLFRGGSRHPCKSRLTLSTCSQTSPLNTKQALFSAFDSETNSIFEGFEGGQNVKDSLCRNVSASSSHQIFTSVCSRFLVERRQTRLERSSWRLVSAGRVTVVEKRRKGHCLRPVDGLLELCVCVCVSRPCHPSLYYYIYYLTIINICNVCFGENVLKFWKKCMYKFPSLESYKHFHHVFNLSTSYMKNVTCLKTFKSGNCVCAVMWRTGLCFITPVITARQHAAVCTQCK